MSTSHGNYEVYSFFDEQEVGQKVPYVTRSKDQEETYPSQWFANNRGQKPKVTVLIRDSDWNSIRT